MGLAWQQGPLATRAAGTFLVSEPLPERLLYAEPLRRRMGVIFGGQSIAESDDVVLLHEPARYPVAYFPRSSILRSALVATDKRTNHPDLGEMTWFEVNGGDRSVPRGAWEHTALPPFARVLEDHVAFAWHAMDGFYEEAERIVGHAADFYHRIDIRRSARHVAVSSHGTQLAETDRAIVLYESGFAPPLVCAAQRYRRRAAQSRSTGDVLPVQGDLQLLRRGRGPSRGLGLLAALPGGQPNRRLRVL
jgi:uncharacterized protein (DUF427 family)